MMLLWRTLVQWLFGPRTRHVVTTVPTVQWSLHEPTHQQEIEVEMITMPAVKLENPACKITHAPSDRLH